ncbi:MAG: tripartite tricarboxylate transporter TctB family protein [Pseudorhodobacter sp.]|nr:tripartite tricarboxylate transporter TctB family protein [Pseudorhodobacter sp.]
MNIRRIDRFVFPAIALAYTGYMVGEQILKDFQNSTIAYALVLAVPIFLLGAVILVKEIRAGQSGEIRGTIVAAGTAWRTVGFLLLVILFILSFEPLGYALSFLIFTLASMLLLGVRSPVALVVTPVAMVAIVHFLFVRFLGMGFPPGLASLLF